MNFENFNELPPEVHAQLAEATKRGLLSSKNGHVSYQNFKYLGDDPYAKLMLQEIIEKEQIRRDLTADFNERHINEGDILIGTDIFTGKAHYHFAREFGNNSVETGVPGTGKTTHLKLLIPQMANQGIRIAAIDSEKEELYSELAPIFKNIPQDPNNPENNKLYKIDIKTSPYNPLQIPETNNPINPKDFIDLISESIASALDISDPGRRLLKQAIFKKYLETGILDSNNDNPHNNQSNDNRDFPTLFEIYESIRSMRKLNALTLEGVLVRLEHVLISLEGLRYRIGESSKTLSSKNVVFECGNVSPECRDLIISTMLVQEFLRRKAERFINVDFKQDGWWIVLDDAQHICTSPDSFLAKKLINVARSAGIAFHFCIQNPRIAPSILANTPTKFCGILANSEDMVFMARCIGASSKDQIQYLTTNLKRGQFATQLSNGWRHPFLLEVQP